MSEKLVIVESPAKAKTIGKILGRDYTIKASYGHIRDLPEQVLGVDIEHGFTPRYEETKTKGRNLSELKQAAKSAKEIYLAPDPDREGEAIAWHLYDVLHKLNPKADFRRVAFHEITGTAIRKAFLTPGKIDMDLVDAQQARRVLDRIVGYMVSPLLWSKIKGGLSAGRVQSVALRIVCEREREIQAFKPEEYWNFEALFGTDGGASFKTRLFRLDGDSHFRISSKDQADALLRDIQQVSSWRISSREAKPRKRYPAPPFITSTLQQAASSALGFSASSTMRTAQQLYEGIDTGSGLVGLITYMRTDSVNVAVEAQSASRAFIEKTYGSQYVPAKPNIYRSKANAQGAHEAIRPTDVNLTPDSIRGALTADQYKLYRLIWHRFLASQMSPADQLRTTVDVEGKNTHLSTFRATATVTTFPGFLKVYNIQEEGARKEDEDGEEFPDSEILGSLSEGAACSLLKTGNEQKFTEPPPRFSEATLIKELESNGIGRPSTYATIVNTIQVRKYVNKDKGKLIPTELGFSINDYLVASLPKLMEINFTAEMETGLDQIEEGKLQWTGMISDFYEKFAQWLHTAKRAGAPEDAKARNLIDFLRGIHEWAPPQKRAKWTYDDKKFYTSIANQAEKGLSLRQWEALMNILVKYESQLTGIQEFLQANGIEKDYADAKTRIAAFTEKREEAQVRQEEAAANRKPEQAELLEALAKVSFNPPERRGARVYDDRKFFDSLKNQADSGKALSEKQIAALLKIAARYSGSIPDFERISAALGGEAVSAAQQVPKEEIARLVEALSKITAWSEPVKKGRRSYDDKEFFDSIARQFREGRLLSVKQAAALKKLASKYGIS